MKREHLVKDGTSLAFLTAFLKSYTEPVSTGSGCGETVESLSSMLRKLNLADLLDFFPLQKRSVTELQKEFKDKKVDPKITEWYLKLVEGWKSNGILRKLEELTDDSGQGRASNEELINYLSTEAKPTTNMADADFIVLVWQGLMSNITAMTEEKTEQQVKEIVLNWVKVSCRSSSCRGTNIFCWRMYSDIVCWMVTGYRWRTCRVHKGGKNRDRSDQCDPDLYLQQHPSPLDLP